jgi:hypothetical protein
MQTTHAILKPTRHALTLVVAFAIGAALGGLTLLTTSGKPPVGGRELPGDVRPLAELFDLTQPLMTDGGYLTTLRAAESAAGYEVPTPDPGVSGSVRLPTPEVWFSPDTREIGLRYGSDLVIVYSSWPGGKDSAKTYEAQAVQFQAGYTTSLNGNPAWIVPKDAQAPGFPEVNVVHISLGAVEATFFGNITLDELTLLASTL